MLEFSNQAAKIVFLSLLGLFFFIKILNNIVFIKIMERQVKEKNTNLSVVLRIIVFLHRFSKRCFVTEGKKGWHLKTGSSHVNPIQFYK